MWKVLPLLAVLANLILTVTSARDIHTKIEIKNEATGNSAAAIDGGNATAAATANANSTIIIRTHEHHQRKCAVNEKYVKCPEKLCQPQVCEDVGVPQCSSHDPEAGTEEPCSGLPACVCKENYVRNHDGICIPAQNCHMTTENSESSGVTVLTTSENPDTGSPAEATKESNITTEKESESKSTTETSTTTKGSTTNPDTSAPTTSTDKSNTTTEEQSESTSTTKASTTTERSTKKHRTKRTKTPMTTTASGEETTRGSESTSITTTTKWLTANPDTRATTKSIEKSDTTTEKESESTSTTEASTTTKGLTAIPDTETTTKSTEKSDTTTEKELESTSSTEASTATEKSTKKHRIKTTKAPMTTTASGEETTRGSESTSTTTTTKESTANPDTEATTKPIEKSETTTEKQSESTYTTEASTTTKKSTKKHRTKATKTPMTTTASGEETTGGSESTSTTTTIKESTANPDTEATTKPTEKSDTKTEKESESTSTTEASTTTIGSTANPNTGAPTTSPYKSNTTTEEQSKSTSITEASTTTERSTKKHRTKRTKTPMTTTASGEETTRGSESTCTTTTTKWLTANPDTETTTKSTEKSDITTEKESESTSTTEASTTTVKSTKKPRTKTTKTPRTTTSSGEKTPGGSETTTITKGSDNTTTTDDSGNTTTDSTITTTEQQSTTMRGPNDCIGKNEWYSLCKPSCPQQTCADYLNRVKCPKSNGLPVCEPECRCHSGYYKDDEGNCLSTWECKRWARSTTNAIASSTTTKNPDNQASTTKMMSTTPQPNCEDVAYELFTLGNLAFNVKLLRDMLEHDPDNDVHQHIVGGASILYLLTTLVVNAKGALKTESLKVLNLPNTELIPCFFPKTSAKINAEYPGIEYSMFSKIYADVNNALTHDYVQNTTQLNGKGPENLDFSSPEAAQKINREVAQYTNNHFPNFVKPNILLSLHGMVMVDAEGFQGKWEKPFDPAKTVMRDFFSPGRIEKIPFMENKGSFLFARSEQLKAKILKLPYTGGEFTFVIFLPYSLFGIKEMLRKMENPKITASAIDSLTYTSLKVSLPKFEISVANRLKKSSQMAGLKEIFNNSTTGLEDIGSGEPPYVSEILQKVSFHVTEVGMGNKYVEGFPESEEKLGRTRFQDFNPNRPFVYTISFQNMVLLIGEFGN